MRGKLKEIVLNSLEFNEKVTLDNIYESYLVLFVQIMFVQNNVENSQLMLPYTHFTIAMRTSKWQPI